MIAIEDVKQRYSAEMAMLILTLRVHLNSAIKGDISVFIGSNNIDWNFFYRLVTAHQIRPVAYNVLSKDVTSVDKRFLEKLRVEAFRIATDNLMRANELKNLTALFRKNKINVIPYKGVILSSLLFNDLITRETCDIDFLIFPSDFSKIKTILLQEGYQFRYYYNEHYEKQLLDEECECMMYKVNSFDKELKIELHWRITHKMMDIPFDISDAFSQTDSAVLLGENIEELKPQLHLLLMLIHHGVNDVWRSLRHLLDLSVLIQLQNTRIDFLGLKRDLIRNKIFKTSEAGFLLCEELFGVRTPFFKSYNFEAQTPKLINSLLRYPMLKREKLSKENFLQHLSLRDSYRDRVRLVISYLSAAIKPNMRDVEALNLPPKLYGLYYVLKPFRLLKPRKL